MKVKQLVLTSKQLNLVSTFILIQIFLDLYYIISFYWFPIPFILNFILYVISLSIDFLFPFYMISNLAKLSSSWLVQCHFNCELRLVL